MKHLLTIISCFVVLSMSAQTDYPFPWNPDADLDGWVSTEDLLLLLTVFGTQFEPDTWETDSISAAVVLDGNHNYFQCQSYCNDIEGNWRMADLDAFGRHFDLASSVSADFWVNSNDKLNSSDFAYDAYQLYGPNGNLYTTSVSNFSQAKKCMCYIQSSPFVPSQYTEDSNLALWDSIESLQIQVQILENELDSLELNQMDSSNFNLFESVANLEELVGFINYGCTDSTACNFDIEAEINNDSCEGLLGCTDSQALNFNPIATCDNQSCIPYVGMYGYGGVVFEVSGNTAYILNIEEEISVNGFPNEVWDAANAIESNGYDDWYVPSTQQTEIFCDQFPLLSLVISLNNGIPLSGYYFHNTSYCTVNGVPTMGMRQISPTSCGNTCGCLDCPGLLRAVRAQSF